MCARRHTGGMLLRNVVRLRSVVLLRCAHVTLPLSSISPPLCPSRTSALPETISSPLSSILVLLSSHSYPLSFLFLASPLVSAESGLCKWRPRISRAAALLAFALSNPSISHSEKRRAALMWVCACERDRESYSVCVWVSYSRNLLSSWASAVPRRAERSAISGWVRGAVPSRRLCAPRDEKKRRREGERCDAIQYDAPRCLRLEATRRHHHYLSTHFPKFPP